MILNGAESFFLPGGPHGVLLVHGFTGSPSEMVLMGDYLHRKGYTVLCMRMAGHGTDYTDMERMTWENWADSVMDGYAILAGCCRKISVAGLSMGGLMAMLLSTKAEIDRIISMAAPVYIQEAMNLELLPPRALSVGRFVMKGRRQIKDLPDLCNVVSRRMPLVSIHELLDCMKYVKDIMPQVNRPIYIIHSKKDRTAKSESAQYIYDNVGSEIKELLMLEESGHRLTVDSERDFVFEKVAQFLERDFD